jgi:hypothetical protein
MKSLEFALLLFYCTFSDTFFAHSIPIFVAYCLLSKMFANRTEDAEESMESTLLNQLNSMESTLRESFLLSQFPLLESELKIQESKNRHRIERLAQYVNELENDAKIQEKRQIRLQHETKDTEKRGLLIYF